VMGVLKNCSWLKRRNINVESLGFFREFKL
jgi:hypothetical protein